MLVKSVRPCRANSLQRSGQGRQTVTPYGADYGAPYGAQIAATDGFAPKGPIGPLYRAHRPVQSPFMAHDMAHTARRTAWAAIVERVVENARIAMQRRKP